MTLYNLCKQSKIPTKPQDLKIMGINIAKAAKAFNIAHEMVVQKEGDEKYTVKDYPIAYIPHMQKLISRFYSLRAKRLVKQ